VENVWKEWLRNDGERKVEIGMTFRDKMRKVDSEGRRSGAEGAEGRRMVADHNGES
jgi:hypothetical protein